MSFRGWILGTLLAAGTCVSAPDAFAQQQKINVCRDGKGDAKLNACTDLIKRGGKDLEAYYYYRSSAWEQKGECDLAVADAEQALKLKRDEHNMSRIAIAWSDCKNDAQKSLSYYDDAVRAFPKSAVVHYNRGVVLMTLTRYDRALADFNKAIQINPKDPDYFYQRGRLWADQEEYDKAIADYSKTIGMKAGYAAAYSYRGVAYDNKDEREKALSDHNTAVRLAPKDADRYDNRAIHYRVNGEFDKALTDNDKAIALEPNSNNHTTRGRTWQDKGDLDRALADLNEAVRLERGTVWSLLHRGILYRYRGEYDRSIADFNRLLEKYPYDATSYVERGRAFEKKGDLVRARADFERALKESGSKAKTAHDDARAQLASLDAGPTATAAKPAAPVAALPTATTQTLTAAPVSSAPTVIAQSGRRVALVIGNSDYTSVPKLANPARDAQAVAGALRGIGFQTVTVGGNLNREALGKALRAFAVEAEKADWAMVYFAGHGIEVGGVNYLVPTDATLAADRDVQFEAVSLEQVMASVEGAKKIKLVVLDACRDNPFAQQMRRTIATRSVGRGLSRVEPEGASLVVYAAKHGQTALDGVGSNNSPFATALTKRIATPGIDITKLFRLVRDDVMEATAGRQEPFTYGSLPGREDFYFVAGK